MADDIFTAKGIPDEFMLLDETLLDKVLPKDNIPLVIYHDKIRKVIGKASIDEKGIMTASFLPGLADPRITGDLPDGSFSFEVNRHAV